MKVKICGLTNLDDALAALDAGADMLGFNFYPASPRYIQPQCCTHLVNALRRRGVEAAMVGVFVNARASEMITILNRCNLDLAQLSGDEPAELLEQLSGWGFKALRPSGAADLEDCLRQYTVRQTAPAWLVDAYRPGEYGGTGQTGDWALAAGLALRYPILLAGGLRPENVAAAVQQVRPWGGDVASGVECAPGRKDPVRMREFVRAARQNEKE